MELLPRLHTSSIFMKNSSLEARMSPGRLRLCSAARACLCALPSGVCMGRGEQTEWRKEWREGGGKGERRVGTRGRKEGRRLTSVTLVLYSVVTHHYPNHTLSQSPSTLVLYPHYPITLASSHTPICLNIEHHGPPNPNWLISLFRSLLSIQRSLTLMVTWSMGLREEQGLVGVAIQFELWTLLVWADGDGHVVSLETGAMWGAAAREVVVFLWWGIREKSIMKGGEGMGERECEKRSCIRGRVMIYRRAGYTR